MEEKSKGLEEYIVNAAKITFRDRVNNVTKNIKRNKAVLLMALTPIGFTLITYSLARTSINEAKFTEKYEKAFNNLTNIEEVLESGARLNIQVSIGQEAYDHLEKLIEEGSQTSYPHQGREVLSSLKENESLFVTSTDSRELLPKIKKISKNLGKIADTTKEDTSAIFGILTGLFSFIAGAVWINYFNNEKNFEDYLRSKKHYKMLIKNDLKNLKRSIRKNQHAGKIYDVLDLLIKKQEEVESLVRFAGILATYREAEYISVFEAVLSNPKKYNSGESIMEAFRFYDHQRSTN